MTMLAIDSTDRGGSIAIAEDGRPLELRYEFSERTHTSRLMPTIGDLLSSRNLGFGDIERVAVATGPGSFTAIRLGVTTAKTLAMVCGADAVGLSSLRLLAEWGRTHDGPVFSVIDARRGELYVREFDGTTGEPADDGRLLEPDQLREICANRTTPLLVYRARTWSPSPGDWPDNTRFTSEALTQPLASALVVAAHRRFEAGEHVDPDRITPRYIRDSDARRSSSPTSKEPTP